MKALLFILPAAVIVATVIYAIVRVRRGASPKKMVCLNLATVGVLLILSSVFAMTVSAAPNEAADATAAAAATETADTNQTDGLGLGLGLLAAGLVTGLAGIGGGIAVAAGAPAAIGRHQRKPKNVRPCADLCGSG